MPAPGLLFIVIAPVRGFVAREARFAFRLGFTDFLRVNLAVFCHFNHLKDSVAVLRLLTP
jgi:hypothetical protein